ncbi:autotransporter outer membrane beta-barrel domain-containing protein [Bosea sp. MMO-172]|uniref:autotransporter outer membrane beta-barrel domain-containing protein n=1 Tax=Bosea sp. MMO-172 TaxID=3127885 RepID=UPI0030175118
MNNRRGKSRISLLLGSTALAGVAAICPGSEAAAQTFTGNQTTSGPFAGGTQLFYDTSALNASAADAVSGGEQYFYSASTLNASAANAVSGGRQYFYNTSALSASAANAFSGGYQYFYTSSTLDASTADAVSGGWQIFLDTSALNASSANAVSGGTQNFYTSSALNASSVNAVSGGTQNFNNTSALNASAANAVSGGTQYFYDGSKLNASAANAVSGGSQIFFDTSALKASAANAVSGGTQYFWESSALNASAANAVSGGRQNFNATSALNASAAHAVSGGQQDFYDTSALNASAANAVSGGTQYFYSTSTLNASAANAVSGGTQFFIDSSVLNASAANAVSGGTQNFYNTSALNASAANAVSGGTQNFGDTSALNASAANAVSGGTQNFLDSSALNASAANAVSGGEQYFWGTSALNASAANAVSGGMQDFNNTSSLNASAANAVNGGTQYFWGTSALNASAANAVSGGTQYFSEASVLNVLAGNALTKGVTVNFDNRYSGPGGRLRLNGYSTVVGAVRSLSAGSGIIENGGAADSVLTIDGSTAGHSSFSGLIRDGGAGRQGLTLAGGTLTLDGVHSYTGPTNVDSGATLAVNGTIASSQMLTINGTVAGIGTIGNTSVNAGGTIAPGNGGIGTLSVQGNLAMVAGSRFAAQIDGTGASDRITVTGAANISGATLDISASGMALARYTVLTTTGGLTGTFVVGPISAFVGVTASYDANNAYLDLSRMRDFADAGATRNQKAAAYGIQSISGGNPLFTGNALYNAILALPTDATARNAFDQLSGEVHASATTALIEDSHFVRDAATNRIRAAFGAVGASRAPVMAYADPADGKTGYAAFASLGSGAIAVAPTTDRFALWGQGFGGWGFTNGDGNAARLSRSTGGFLIGGDAPIFDTWRLGMMAGYSRTTFNVRDRASSGSSDNYHLGLYAGTQWGNLGFRTGAAYTWHDITTSRSVAFPGFGDSLKGDYRAGTAQVFGELGYGIRAGRFGFEPFANLAYVNLSTGGFAENGGAAALSSNSARTGVTFTTLGLHASTDFDLGTITATLRSTLGWRHAFGDTTPLATFALAGGSPFTVAGVPIAKDALVLDVGLDVAITRNATLGISYGGQYGGNTIDQSVRANFNVRF